MMKKSGFALAALLCIAAPLAAADEFAAYQKASAELAALAQPAHSASPEAAPLFAIVSDSKRFLDNRSFSQGDLGQLKEMCKAAVEQANRYVTHDVQKAGTAAASADLKAVAEARWAQSDRNIRLYQDELGLLFPFTVRCNARVVSLSESKFASLKKEEVTEESINGAREIQKTAFDNIKSSIVLISNKQLSEANSLRVGRAALETAQAYMSVLPLSEREKLKGVEVSAELNSAMNEELKLSDAEAAILAQLNTAMWEKNCSAMCMVSLPNSSPFLPYLEAAKQLQATQPVTRLSTPQGAALLTILSDRRRFLEGEGAGLSKLDELGKVCEATKTVMDAYSNHGYAAFVKDTKGGEEELLAGLLLLDQNLVKFQDELALLREFSFHCKARMISLMKVRFSALPPEQLSEHLSAFDEFREQLKLDYMGILNLTHRPTLRPANVRRVLQAMVELAPVLTTALPLDNRQFLLGLAEDPHFKSSAEYAKDVAPILRGLENIPCEALCKL